MTRLARAARNVREHAQREHSLAERSVILDAFVRWIAEGAQGRPRCVKCKRALDG